MRHFLPIFLAQRLRRARVSLSRFIAAAALVISLNACSKQARPLQPMTHEAYVWQRKWTPEVRAGIERATPALDGLNVLIGEVGWKQGVVRVASANVDFAALAATKKPVGFGLRIGAFSGAFTAHSPVLESAIHVLDEALKSAAAASLRPSEVQIDFDCPSSKLAGYAIWVREIHARFPRTPIAITALPDWLERRDFPPLAKAAGAFVLQVHAVPGARGSAPVICDPEAARGAVSRAARIGVPFRVALPTYGCEMFLDIQGQVLAVRAEDTSPPPPKASRMVALRSDAPQMAGLISQWKSDRPSAMRGICWYRLPIDNERNNWRWETLATILAGKTPLPRGSVVLDETEPGLADVVLENQGAADWRIPDHIFIHAAEDAAADGVNGFQADSAEGGTLSFEPVQPRWLSPGERLVCGWVRCPPTAKLTADFSPSTP